MIASVWSSLPRVVPEVRLDVFVVMPNHVHGIIQLVDNDSRDGPTLGFVLQTFKRLTTHHYVQGVLTDGWPRFDSRIWQRSFHDHIIRNEREMDRLREYVLANPARWAEDRYHTLTEI
jgi:REP element-mobilizing transposase RayT